MRDRADGRSGAVRRRRAAPRRRASRAGFDRVARVDEHVDQRDAQPLGVGRDRRQRRDRARASTRRARRRRLGRGRRLAAERVEVGRRQLEADRPREVEHLVDDPVQPRDLLVDVGDRLAQRRGASASGCRSVCSDALMIISGLRTSCAMTVDSRPSDDSRSFCDISRWNRAIESVSVLNVVASSRASSSSQRLAVAQRDLARQVAGRRDLAHHVGDGGERARDRARDGEAEERREQHGDDGGDGELGVNRLQEAQLLGARAEDQRDRRRRRPVAGRRPADSGRGSTTYSSPPMRHARRCRCVRRRRRAPAVVLARQRRRQNLAVHAEGDVAAGDLLQLRRERVVEQEADAERAENLGLRQADRRSAR